MFSRGNVHITVLHELTLFLSLEGFLIYNIILSIASDVVNDVISKRSVVIQNKLVDKQLKPSWMSYTAAVYTDEVTTTADPPDRCV